MKPCSRNRKLIAWLALDALDNQEASALRDHLDHCEGCHRYWEEVSNVAAKLAAAEADSDFEASEAFHRRVAEKVRATKSSSAVEVLVARLRRLPLSWRLALPAAAALVIALLVMISPRQPQTVSLPAPAVVQVIPPSRPASGLVPTVANYQFVASQSLEQLDELLIRQGNQPLPPAPVYTPSRLALANGPF